MTRQERCVKYALVLFLPNIPSFLFRFSPLILLARVGVISRLAGRITVTQNRGCWIVYLCIHFSDSTLFPSPGPKRGSNTRRCARQVARAHRSLNWYLNRLLDVRRVVWYTIYLFPLLLFRFYSSIFTRTPV